MADADKTRIMSATDNTENHDHSNRTQQWDRTQILPAGQDLDRTRVINTSPDQTLMLGGAFPTAQTALVLSASPENAYIKAGANAREHLLFEIRNPGSDAAIVGGINSSTGMRLPLNISLVLDRSGSMEGEPLERAKQACTYVVDLLEPNDILSIVTFSDNADVIMPARKVVNKEMVKDYIGRIQTGNTTNLYEGLSTACQQVASVKSEHTLNRVILLTDGEPTAGIKDFASIVAQVAEQKARGISVTALGFGPDYNEELMAGIARRSGGNYYHISRPELLIEVFRAELQSLTRITARNLKLRLHLPIGVTVRQVYGQQPIAGNRTAEITLSDVERGSVISSLWELEIGPRPSASYRAARAELVYDDGITGRSEKIGADAVVTATNDMTQIAAGADPRVRNEIAVAQAARSLDQTVMGMRTTQIDRTMLLQELNRTKTLMLDRGMLIQAGRINSAIDDIHGGGEVEKTLMGTIYNLEQGKSV